MVYFLSRDEQGVTGVGGSVHCIWRLGYCFIVMYGLPKADDDD
jgi:hypothetical protein